MVLDTLNAGHTINPRGEIVADATKQKKITMTGNVAGEDGTDWFAGEHKTASAGFADRLIGRSKAVEGHTGDGKRTEDKKAK